MAEPWDLVFFYNCVEMTTKSFENIRAEFSVPAKGGTMRRGGKVWTAVDVRKTEPLSTGGNPVYRIFLTDEPHRGPKSLEPEPLRLVT